MNKKKKRMSASPSLEDDDFFAGSESRINQTLPVIAVDREEDELNFAAMS